MNISFTETGWKEYLYWQSKDKKTIKRINLLLQDIDRNCNDVFRALQPLYVVGNGIREICGLFPLRSLRPLRLRAK